MHGVAAGLAVAVVTTATAFASTLIAPPDDAITRDAAHVRWHNASPGVETGELHLQLSGEANVAVLGRVRVVLVRLDPARFTWALERGAAPSTAWHVSDAPTTTAVAFNAGQFTDEGPWGWVVHRGHEIQAAGRAPLASALVFGAHGAVDIVDASALDTARAAARRGDIVEAVQSYPTLLRGNGDLPDALRAAGRGVDLTHRDARLAVGVAADGSVIVALTRFDAPRTLPGAAGDAVNEALGRVPLGLTVPESATLMRALGCRRAVLLDGGLSAQLLVRGAGGEVKTWAGLRAVPLGLVATPRTQ